MKTIFITIRDGEVSKNILLSSVFSLLKEKTKIVLLVAKNKLDYFTKNYAVSNVFIEVIPDPTLPRLEDWFQRVFLYSLHTKSILVKIEFSYFSGGNFLGRFAKKALWFFGQLLLRSNLLQT